MVIKTEFGLLDQSLWYFNKLFWQRDVILTRADRIICMPLLQKCEEFKVVTKEESSLVIWHCLSLRTVDVHSQNKHLVLSLCQAVFALKKEKRKVWKIFVLKLYSFDTLLIALYFIIMFQTFFCNPFICEFLRDVWLIFDLCS